MLLRAPQIAKPLMQLGSLKQLPTSLASLGAKRLILLAVAAATVFLLVIGGSWFASRPSMEPLFSGLNPAEATRIGVALRDAGIVYDVSPDGTRVMVARGQSSRARGMLAQRGMPGSAGGYEIFDKLGPMGLTSFMQEVTRVRALEGELARTIQGLRGVVAARVHIVMPDPGSFRRQPQPPSASVVIRTEVADDATAVPAIRHLVAAAVPGLTLENVRILSAHGAVLVADPDENAPSRQIELQKSIAANLQNNIRRTLAPYLGVGNLEVSVSVALNIDRKQVAETAFDPEKRVERSSRVVRETNSAQSSGARQAVSVEQNVPTEQPAGQAADASRKAAQKREEITNYEVPSRSTTTNSAGYRVERITAAIVVNRKRIAEQLGSSTPEAIAREVAEIERLAIAAAGIDPTRDKLTVAALDFSGETGALVAIPALGIAETLASQAGTALNAAAVVVVALLVVFLGFRPLTRALINDRPGSDAVAALAVAPASGADPAQLQQPTGETARLASEFEKRRSTMPSARVAEMIDIDRQQAVTVLRRWIREGGEA